MSIFALTNTAPAFNKVPLKAWKQLAERPLSPISSPCGCRDCAYPPVNRPIGKWVALKHDDLFKMIRQCPGRSQPRDPGANDDGLACNASEAMASPRPLHHCPSFFLFGNTTNFPEKAALSVALARCPLSLMRTKADVRQTTAREGRMLQFAGHR